MAEQARETFYIHNTSRDPRKREIRRHLVGPDRSRLNLRIGGGTLEVRRGRPLPVSGVLLRRFLPELRDLEKKGLLEVFDHRSQRVDIEKLSDAPQATDPKKVKADAKRERHAVAAAPSAPKVEEPPLPPPPPEPTNVEAPPEAEPEVFNTVEAEPPLVETAEGPMVETETVEEIEALSQDTPDPPTNPDTPSSRGSRKKRRR